LPISLKASVSEAAANTVIIPVGGVVDPWPVGKADGVELPQPTTTPAKAAAATSERRAIDTVARVGGVGTFGTVVSSSRLLTQELTTVTVWLVPVPRRRTAVVDRRRRLRSNARTCPS